MIESCLPLPVQPPDVQRPPPLKERRAGSRRAEDQIAMEERTVLRAMRAKT